MNFKPYFLTLPLLWGINVAHAEPTHTTRINLSAQVSRTVEQDLMSAVVFSTQTGKQLPALRKNVATNLNAVLAQAKASPAIEVQADGINNTINYDNKGKVIGWTATGYIHLKSKDFDALANVLENLGAQVAIQSIDFSVSPEAMNALEDDMLLAALKQLQHKATLAQQGLNGTGYRIESIELNTPRGEYDYAPRLGYAMKATSFEESQPLPLEAGKSTISAHASGVVLIEK